jgi:hypothetical protein
MPATSELRLQASRMRWSMTSDVAWNICCIAMLVATLLV